MDEQIKDRILDRVRKIESMAEIMEMCFGNFENARALNHSNAACMPFARKQMASEHY